MKIHCALLYQATTRSHYFILPKTIYKEDKKNKTLESGKCGDIALNSMILKIQKKKNYSFRSWEK